MKKENIIVVGCGCIGRASEAMIAAVKSEKLSGAGGVIVVKEEETIPPELFLEIKIPVRYDLEPFDLMPSTDWKKSGKPKKWKRK